MTIVIPDQPVAILRAYSTDYLNKPLSTNLTQRLAAERLQMLIARALGTTPAIVPAASAPKAGMRIFVGYGPHLAGRVEPPDRPEALKIMEKEGDLFLLGEIAAAGVNNWPVPADRGVMHAVETFAEQVMGYRFLHSPPDDPAMFELGTVIPRLETLPVASGLLIEDAPVYKTRLLSTRGRLIGLRGCSSQNFQCNHSYGMAAWSHAYGKDHPEMFLPKTEQAPGGVREAAMLQQHDLGFLDYTEPKVLEARLKHLEGWFDRRECGDFFAGRTPNDTYIMEEVPDRVAGVYQYNERSRALWNPDHGRWAPFSAIWFDYVNRLAAETGKRWPEMRIATLAYNRHYQPPVFAISNRIDVMLTLMSSSTQCKEPEIWKHNLGMVRKWSAKLGSERDRLLLWEYGLWPGYFITAPTFFPHSMQRWLQTVKPYVSGVFFEFYDPVQVNFLMRRIWMRLLWNPDLDVDAEIRDVCHAFYGPAAEPMIRFYKLLAERYEMRWKNPRPIWNQYYVWPRNYYGESYDPPTVFRLAALLEEAGRLAGLSAEIEAELRNGSAIHVLNTEDTPAPAVIEIEALKQDLADPAMGWGDAAVIRRVTWRGSLRPGERLLLDASGKAELQAADGTTTDVRAAVQGTLPTLPPGGDEVFHFWHRRLQRDDALFRARVRYGRQAEPPPAGKNLYARRMEWIRTPYRVLHPVRIDKCWHGFFAEARVAHRHLGAASAYGVAAVPALPAGLDDQAWADVPALELVMGKTDSSVPFEIMGFPADLRTTVKIVHAPEGLAIRITAAGKPVDGEKVAIAIQDRTIEFEVRPGADKAAPLAGLQVDEDGWQALVVHPREALGIPGESLKGQSADMQIRRMRAAGAKDFVGCAQTADMENYIWPPPLGMWGDGEQGPGRLDFN